MGGVELPVDDVESTGEDLNLFTGDDEVYIDWATDKS